MLINWNRNTIPEELILAMEQLNQEYPLEKNSADGVPISFIHAKNKNEYKIKRDSKGFNIKYGSVSMAMRAIGTILSGVLEENGEFSEERTFHRLGMMLDCSRNAVMKVSHFKKWLLRLALMGYNEAMLYTEDTFILPGEPYFGYMRGAYSLEELQEIDRYASALGIEMIPCIQTLGHLSQIMRWPIYNEIKDTSSVLLVDEAKTYKLIEKMLDFWSVAFQSRRIHIGMDETHDLGRGKFMDEHGYEQGFDLFNRHLKKVVK